MKLTYFFIFLAVILSVSCGSAPERVRNSPPQNSNSPTGQNSDQRASTTTTANANGEPEAPVGSVLDRQRGDKPMVDVNPGGTPPPPQFRKAGEDSEIAVTMNRDGSILEIRRFKNHPQLSRVEASWNGPGAKSLKYFLKGGKVLTVSTERIANLQTAPVNLLLEIAGLQAAAAPPPTTGSTEKKPSQ